MTNQQIDLRPFQLFIPVPPMLAEAIGYTGQVLGHPLNGRWVGFYWQRSGDEVEFDDGKSSGTGEWTGYLAFVQHSKVAVHLQHCDFGSSETSPRHMLVLDCAEQHLYALPVRLAQQFLALQWIEHDQEHSHMGGTLESLEAVLNLDSWKEVPFPGDIGAQVAANMQRQDQLVNALVDWLSEQHTTLTPERIKEFTPRATALLLRHVPGGERGFARAGELVHLHEIRTSGDQVTILFYRDNGIDGPDTSQVFVVSGTWATIVETIEILLDLGTLDDLLKNKAQLQQVYGRYADWHGQAFPIVPMLETLAIRVALLCARCGRPPMTAFARAGLHRGGFSSLYNALGEPLVDLSNQQYVCTRCNGAESTGDE